MGKQDTICYPGSGSNTTSPLIELPGISLLIPSFCPLQSASARQFLRVYVREREGVLQNPKMYGEEQKKDLLEKFTCYVPNKDGREESSE